MARSDLYKQSKRMAMAQLRRLPNTRPVNAPRRNPLKFPKVRNIFMEPVVENASRLASTAEIAFIAGLSDKDINRLVDERVLPNALFHTGNGRRFERICAAFARFFYDTADILTKDMRKLVIADLFEQILRKSKATAQACLGLHCAKARVPADIKVRRSYVAIDLTDVLSTVQSRAELADRAHKKIVQNPAILSGEPVFKGTRVLIDTVLESLEGGNTLAELQADWQFLDAALVESARVYRTLHPRRGRPRRLLDSMPHARLLSHTVIAPRSAKQ